MTRTRIARILIPGLLAAGMWAQAPRAGTAPPVAAVEQPDAQRTRADLTGLLERYPPSLKNALASDSSLLGNAQYLAAYPALGAFLGAHPEIARNPAFYIGDGPGYRPPQDHASQVTELWRDVIQGMAVFAGFGMAIGLLVWLIRTFIDYRRWSRLAKVQTDVHTKLLDRFTANEDLLTYIQSPAGSKFLESSPIKLDAGPRSVGAPLARILWSVQGGVVLVAGGVGLHVISGRAGNDAAQPLQALGILAIALGLGFLFSAALSFLISQRLGLIETPPGPRAEITGGEGHGILR